MGTDFDCDGGLVAAPHADISPALKAQDGKGPASDGDGDGAILVPMLSVAHALTGEGFDASEDGTGRSTPLIPVEPYTLAIRGRGDSHDLEYRQDGTANALLTPNGGRGGIGVGAIAFNARQDPISGPISGPIDTDGSTQAVAFAQNQRDEVRTMDVAGALAAEPGMKQQTYIATSAVRRLTPRECERLQGFPDDYTLISVRGKPAADGPRYKALGNSMAVPVMRWIGARIAAVDALFLPLGATDLLQHDHEDAPVS